MKRLVLAIMTVALAGTSARAALTTFTYLQSDQATGAGSIMRRFPIVAGIDVAGTVESSTDARFQPGDQVLVTGYDLGVAHDGGYAARVREIPISTFSKSGSRPSGQASLVDRSRREPASLGRTRGSQRPRARA